MSEDPTPTARPLGATDVEPAVAPLSPPGYELGEEIGHGGMGVVYRARDIALARDVAVKLLSERCPADSLAAERFLREARITGQLQHPGIPAVHQVGTLADGRPFLVMKLIKGSTLEVLLQRRTDPSTTGGRLPHSTRLPPEPRAQPQQPVRCAASDRPVAGSGNGD
jgi:serine/threonine protein kinase